MEEPHIQFDLLVPGGIRPCRADKSADGVAPTRAYRYCEPFRLASSYGYYVYLPFDLKLMSDGVDVTWSLDGRTWYALDSVQYPRFTERFDAAAPDCCSGFAPPFLTRIGDPGMIQIWTGVIATTRPDWSLLVRAPANVVTSQQYRILEGIVDTDIWRGPLFTNVKLLSPGPMTIRADQPFLQVQPVYRAHHDDRLLDRFEVRDGFSSFDWPGYERTMVSPNRAAPTERPLYATESRKRRSRDRRAAPAR